MFKVALGPLLLGLVILSSLVQAQSQDGEDRHSSSSLEQEAWRMGRSQGSLAKSDQEIAQKYLNEVFGPQDKDGKSQAPSAQKKASK